MKNKASGALSILLCAVLVLVGLCVGCTRSWTADRDKALADLGKNEQLVQALSERGMDAANLAVVVARHLDASDADLVSLRKVSETLMNPGRKFAEAIAADRQLTDLAASLARRLPDLEGRDKDYMVTLTGRISAASVATVFSADLDQACDAFDKKLTSWPIKMIAQLFGAQTMRQTLGLAEGGVK